MESNGKPLLGQETDSIFRAIASVPKGQFQWVVESGSAMGCVLSLDRNTGDNTACNKLPFLPIQCIGSANRAQIKASQFCATKLRTVFRWLDDKAEKCGEFAILEEEKDKPLFYLNETEKSLCGYTWVTKIEKNEFMFYRDAGRHFFHPLSRLSLNNLTSSIANLTELDPIPLESYSQPSREVGAALVYKIYEEKEKDSKEKFATFNPLENSEIQIAFKIKHLSSIVQNGFLNQFQTGTTGGSQCLDCRKKEEDRLIGRKIEPENDDGSGQETDAQTTARINEVRPKYAFLMPDGSASERVELGHRYGDSFYGEVIAILKPQVKDRATFTTKDSLFTGGDKTFDHSLRRTFKSPMKTPDFPGNQYWEAQIWGSLRIDEDVNYFLWNCFSYLGSVMKQGTETDLEKLKALGKPVYECIADVSPGSTSPNRFRKGSRL